MPRPADLTVVASALVSDERGILAADESIATMSARLTAEKVTPTQANRRDYRELLLTAPGLEETVSGIILCDETFRQELSSGEAFPAGARRLGILPGIKVDTGTQPFPGATAATVTTGLDGLGDRLAEYADLGAAFAKWRAVIDIADPDEAALAANAEALAEYAALCQQHGIVPIVEPEVLCSGDHELSTCAEVTRMALALVFDPAAGPWGRPLGHRAQAEHGHTGPRQHRLPGTARRGRRIDARRAPGDSSERGAGDRVPLGRTREPGGLPEPRRDQPGGGRRALAAHLLVRPCARERCAARLGWRTRLRRLGADAPAEQLSPRLCRNPSARCRVRSSYDSSTITAVPRPSTESTRRDAPIRAQRSAIDESP